MRPGPDIIFRCPFCWGPKRFSTLASGNTCYATIWSDTRRDYPLLPQISPILQCSYCHKYFFTDYTTSRTIDTIFSSRFRSSHCKHLEYWGLKEAHQQMSRTPEKIETSGWYKSLRKFCASIFTLQKKPQPPLTKTQRGILNRELFMAYNECFRSNTGTTPPNEDDKVLYAQTIEALLDDIDQSEAPDSALFHAELLRETGRFAEAKEILDKHDVEKDKWIVKAMMTHIDALDTEPFLLVKDGKKLF